MTKFNIHNVDTAPESTKKTLQKIQDKYGAIPGLFGAFAESPAILEAYPTLQNIFETKTTLSSTEQQLIFIAVSVENECYFCVPAHSYIAKNVTKVDPQIIDDLRQNRPLADNKLNALVNFTKTLVKNRGHLNDDQINTFLEAGYSKEQVLEVILGVSVKTISNYTSHITNPPLGMFESEKWQPTK